MLLSRLLTIDPLSSELKDIIVGTLLGDAKMTFSNIGNAAYVYELGALHKDMLFHTTSGGEVFGLFGMYVAKKLPVEYKRVDKRTGKTTISYYFSTITHSIFHPFAQMQVISTSRNHQYQRVPNTRRVIKILPSNIAELLTPRALAYWIMDDGQYVKRGLVKWNISPAYLMYG